MKDIVINASPSKLKAKYTVVDSEPVFMDMRVREMKFYRYETIQYGEHTLIPNLTLILRELNLVDETPKGYWICFGNPVEGMMRSHKRWVSKTTKKRYAYPTKAEAMNNFVLRKKMQKRILKAQLEICQSALELGLSEQERQHYHGADSRKVL